MEFTQHQIQQQAAAIQSQLLAIKERLDLLEETRRDQPLMIIAESGSVLPWTNEPLEIIGIHACKLKLGNKEIAAGLSREHSEVLKSACLSHRLSNKQTFDVREYLGKL